MKISGASKKGSDRDRDTDFRIASWAIPIVLNELAGQFGQDRELFSDEDDSHKWEQVYSRALELLDPLIPPFSKHPLTRARKEHLARTVCKEILGWGPLQELMDDPAITEIMVNGPDMIFIEKGGQVERAPVRFRDADHVMNLLQKIVSPLGRRIDQSNPMVDARLPDGSRVNAVVYPVSMRGPYLTIRRFREESLKLDDLLDMGALSVPMAAFLRLAVAARLNIIVSGGTGAGKTTLLNILGGLAPTTERIVTVEDSAELQIHKTHPDVCSLEARPRNIEGRGEIPIRELVRNALRMRPDRVIVGEVRGVETFDMLQAMNTGHDGSFTTAHANSASDLFTRLETMICMAAPEIPLAAVKDMIASALYLVVHVSRMRDGSRRIVQIAEVSGIAEGSHISLIPIWNYKVTGSDNLGHVEGYYDFFGLPKLTRERIENHGFSLKEMLGSTEADRKPGVARAAGDRRDDEDRRAKRDRRQVEERRMYERRDEDEHPIEMMVDNRAKDRRDRDDRRAQFDRRLVEDRRNEDGESSFEKDNRREIKAAPRAESPDSLFPLESADTKFDEDLAPHGRHRNPRQPLSQSDAALNDHFEQHR